jgi:hypothetical protein
MKGKILSNYTDQIGKVSMTSVVGLLICALSSAPLQAASPGNIIAVTVQGDGTVTSDPAGVRCPADCTESYKRQRYVILTASAGADAGFLGWEGDCSGTQPICRVGVRGSKNVTALFDEPLGNQTALNSGGSLPEADPAPDQASVADGPTFVPDASTGEAIKIQLGWPAFTTQ